MKKKMVFTAASSVLGTLVVLLLVVLIVTHAGAYNVSAAVGHTAVERWALATMMRNSVQRRADAEAPPQFTTEMILSGAGEYKAMCQHCHGGPGISRAEWAKGIVPSPPDLTRSATEWTPSEVHWIVSNGIKMTAMPSFGATHEDDSIWNITAFVKQLPAMTPETYASFPSDHGTGS